jgi:hypothetical protein
MDGYWYTVGERTGDYHYRKPLYRITFDSGYETVATSQDLWRNRIKDWGSPSILGKAIVGYPKATKDPLFSRWCGVLNRCLTNRWKGYEDVSLDPRWLDFRNFREDAVKLSGYDADRLDDLVIDKDRLGMPLGRREYGPETCSWLTVPENCAFRRRCRHTKAPASGFRGVTFLNDYWLARVQIKGKKTSLGCFTNPLDAACAVLERFPGYYLPEEQARIRCAVRDRRAKEAIFICLIGRKGWFSLAELEREAKSA